MCQAESPTYLSTSPVQGVSAPRQSWRERELMDRCRLPCPVVGQFSSVIYTVAQRDPRAMSCSCPSVTVSLTPLCTLSSLPCLPGFPENCWHPTPRLRVCFWGPSLRPVDEGSGRRRTEGHPSALSHLSVTAMAQKAPNPPCTSIPLGIGAGTHTSHGSSEEK